MRTEVKCQQCSKKFLKKNSEIKKSKNHFCNRSCSITYQNKNSPKRKRNPKACKYCGEDITYLGEWTRVTCGKCKPDPRYVSLEDVFSTRVPTAANAYIREKSRRAYKNSGLPMTCKICGYDKHVDIAHIKGVKEFPKSAEINTVNHLDNLVALCKNHHWEFDHNLLDEVDREGLEPSWTT